MEVFKMSEYELFAIKYADRDAKANDHFYGHPDPHEDYSMPMDYFIWVAKSENQTIVIDVGFNEEVAEKRNRNFIKSPVELLKEIGIEPETVDYVIITHLHYDHIGNLSHFPNAKYIIQEKELSFWTGKYAGKPHFKSHVEKEDILYLVDQNFSNRVIFVDGNVEVFPGVHLYLVGGHSPGLQMVKVNTPKGNVLLTSDAAHFYKNINEERPFIIVVDLPAMYDGFDLIKKLEKECVHIVPGHDPMVIELFQSPNSKLQDLVVKIE